MSSDPDFDELVLATQRSVRSFIAGMGVPLTEVDDIAQDVYLDYYRQRERRPPHVETLAWLKGIARNHTLRWYRSLGTRGQHLRELGELLAERPEPATNDLADVLHGCLARLGERQREMLDWYYRDNLPSATIGERLRTSAAVARVMIQRLRDALRECIRRSMARPPEAEPHGAAARAAQAGGDMT